MITPEIRKRRPESKGAVRSGDGWPGIQLITKTVVIMMIDITSTCITPRSGRALRSVAIIDLDLSGFALALAFRSISMSSRSPSRSRFRPSSRSSLRALAHCSGNTASADQGRRHAFSSSRAENSQHGWDCGGRPGRWKDREIGSGCPPRHQLRSMRRKLIRQPHTRRKCPSFCTGPHMTGCQQDDITNNQTAALRPAIRPLGKPFLTRPESHRLSDFDFVQQRKCKIHRQCRGQQQRRHL